MNTRYATGFFVAIALIATTGCGGGSAPPNPTPTPFVVPESTTTPLNNVSGVDVGMGGSNYAMVSFSTPTTTSGTVAVNGGPSLPSGVAQLGSGVYGLTFAGFVSFTPSTSVAYPSGPQLIFRFPYPGTVPNVQYYVAYLAPGTTTWVQPLLGPRPAQTVVSTPIAGQTPGPGDGPSLWIGFDPANQPLSLAAGKTYYYALYSVPN